MSVLSVLKERERGKREKEMKGIQRWGMMIQEESRRHRETQRVTESDRERVREQTESRQRADRVTK